ncbi:MAG: hypothetical protein ACRD0N_14055, partial [Acidimicrobiales bacterium]
MDIPPSSPARGKSVDTLDEGPLEPFEPMPRDSDSDGDGDGGRPASPRYEQDAPPIGPSLPLLGSTDRWAYAAPSTAPDRAAATGARPPAGDPFRRHPGP